MPLFDDPNEALAVVAQDLRTGFEGVFEELERPAAVSLFAEEAVGTESGSLSVVAWQWHVLHVGELQGTPATGRELTMRGVTVIEPAEAVMGRGELVVDEDADSEVVFSRYIDWLALYAELGAVTIARPLVEDRRDIPDNVPHPVDPDG